MSSGLKDQSLQFNELKRCTFCYSMSTKSGYTLYRLYLAVPVSSNSWTVRVKINLLLHPILFFVTSFTYLYYNYVIGRHWHLYFVSI